MRPLRGAIQGRARGGAFQPEEGEEACGLLGKDLFN